MNTFDYRTFLRKKKKKNFPGGSAVENLPAMQETYVWSLGQEDPLEKEMATHSSILAWEIPWTEEISQAVVHGVARVRYDLATKPPPPHSIIH